MVTYDNQNRYKDIGNDDIQDKDIDKKSNKVKDFLKKKSVQAALILALAGAGTYIAHETFKDKEKEKTEQVKDVNKYPFEHHHLAFWDDNKDFSTKNFQLKVDTLAPGIIIKRDAGLTFYIVQKEDIKEDKDTTYVTQKIKIKKGKKTISKKITVPKITTSHVGDFDKIRDKLSAIPEFAYLTDAQYDRSVSGNKTKSFNIPKESITAGLLIPIPLDHKVREISPQDFANYCYDALQEMKSDSSAYNKEIKELLAHTSEKDVIIDMLSFARSETTSEYTNFIKPIGDVELHRREPAFKAFSFTYFHILMEKNANGSDGPGLAARYKLGLTEGQCYHPKNAAKLFLGYRIEKTNGHLNKIFPLTQNNIKEVGKKYNGSSTYVDKLQPNFTYCKKLMNGEIVYYDNTKLKNDGFIYTGLNSHYEHMYKIKTPKGIHSIDELKNYIVDEFNKNKADDCPAVDENDVLNHVKKAFTGDIIPDTVFVKIPKK